MTRCQRAITTPLVSRAEGAAPPSEVYGWSARRTFAYHPDPALPTPIRIFSSIFGESLRHGPSGAGRYERSIDYRQRLSLPPRSWRIGNWAEELAREPRWT